MCVYFNRARKEKYLRGASPVISSHIQDKKLLKIVKQRTQDEVRSMRSEVQAMRNKIEEYNRNIDENLRFLRGLERDLSADDKKN